MNMHRGFAAMMALYIGIALVVLGGAAYVLVRPDTLKAPEVQNNTQTGQMHAGEGKVGVNWKFDDLGEDALGMPRTKVFVAIGEPVYEVGDFEGTCRPVGAEGGVDGKGLLIDQGEVAAAQCWFAGGGNEIGIFKTATGLSIQVGELSEGDAENAGFRGSFVTKLNVSLTQ